MVGLPGVFFTVTSNIVFHGQVTDDHYQRRGHHGKNRIFVFVRLSIGKDAFVNQSLVSV